MRTLSKGVFRIEDANTKNPAGLYTDSTGNQALNNCSDMYLIVGSDKALLVDLSTFVKWDTTAISSLQSLVKGVIENRELYITVTHHHWDHLGMLPAFKQDVKVKFWLQVSELEDNNPFPIDRTINIANQASLSLGDGYIVNSFLLPGHTVYSTIFFLQGKNLVFSGDGLGGGNGVWIFSYDGFLKYKSSISKLITYIEDKKNNIDAKKLFFLSGHYWQKLLKTELNFDYILDMQALIGKIGAGKAEEVKVEFDEYLNMNFKFGSAIITWNKADELKYIASQSSR